MKYAVVNQKNNKSKKIKIQNSHKSTHCLGKILVEFTRHEIAQVVAHNFCRRTFDGRPLSCRYFSPYKYRKNFKKGLNPSMKNDKVQLSLDMREKLIISDIELFGSYKLK